MKIDIKEVDTKKYPCLMKNANSGTIVLFVRDHCGTIIDSPIYQEQIGRYETSWDMRGFYYFHGEVTISND